jgi:hypothetical protein
LVLKTGGAEDCFCSSELDGSDKNRNKKGADIVKVIRKAQMEVPEISCHQRFQLVMIKAEAYGGRDPVVRMTGRCNRRWLQAWYCRQTAGRRGEGTNIHNPIPRGSGSVSLCSSLPDQAWRTEDVWRGADGSLSCAVGDSGDICTNR